MIGYISDALVTPRSLEPEPFIIIVYAEGIVWTFSGALNGAIPL
jgi:hypothetical protein